ncbi:TIGR02450 family Trp-rich protein [Shewanella sp. VB17]|uniref:TIGR02450 family Trp-rich protein n=1 Tax=Shewanella sp. VB17 TaxID=2739432 RepID=UPI0015653FE3|nr:TIGR02450 family Trp-rich protein [Shewanella sp. VB17]NRD72667.1 TIGR02450 family Trp-rich protein [Shewanella sp. VB17]
MNKVNQKALLNSKWTKSIVINKEKHFIIVNIELDETQKVSLCVIEAVMTHQEYEIDWRSLKDPKQWKVGWQ